MLFIGYNYSQALPDLIVENVDYQSQLIRYQKLKFKCIIKNNGSINISETFYNKIFFSKDSILDKNDLLYGSSKSVTLKSNELIMLEEFYINENQGVIADSTYKYLFFKLDTEANIDEANETNNVWRGQVMIHETTADLVIQTLELQNDTIYFNEVLEINISFSNFGNDDVAGIKIKSYLSNDSIFDSSDQFLRYSNFDLLNSEYSDVFKTCVFYSEIEFKEFYIFSLIDMQDGKLSNNIAMTGKIMYDFPKTKDIINFESIGFFDSFKEDGYQWKFENEMHITDYRSHTGEGSVMMFWDDNVKLSASSLIDVQGIWILPEIDRYHYLLFNGYNEYDSRIYQYYVDEKELDNYCHFSYIRLNWKNIKSIEIDYYPIIDGECGTFFLYFDDIEYTYLNIPVIDNDGDGYIGKDDCNDSDPMINPSAQELPGNGIDENCDGLDSLVFVNELFYTSINVYPNPVTGGKISIQTSRNKITKIELFNSAFCKIKELYYSLPFSDSEIYNFDLTGIKERGIYFLRISTDDGVFYRKIIL
ncbi:MAG: CARDB domain-containing protein [Deltaproteobacteria bacterium]